MSMTSPTSSWIDEIWPRLVKATGIGYLATSYAVSRWLTRRSPARVELPGLLSHLEIESLACRTRDGILLKGWLLGPARPRATVALFHGLRDNRCALLSRIEFLTAAGYRCVAFDHRAHGESTGSHTSFGYHERHDVAAVAHLVQARWPNDPRAALGVSMGAAALCFAGDLSKSFDTIVLESVYHDIFETFRHRVGCDFPGWFKHFAPGIIWMTERRLGAHLHEVAPISHIAGLAPRPLLLLTGSEDPHARPEEVQMLADKAHQTSRFHIVPGAGHRNVCAQGGRAYRRLILSFLDQHLFGTSESRQAA